MTDQTPRKTRINKVRRKQKNGWTHVYEIESFYDPAIKNSRAIRTKLIGKLAPGVSDLSQMVPTRPKAPSKKKPEQEAGLPVQTEQPSAEPATELPALEDSRQQSKVVYPLDIVFFVIMAASAIGMGSCRQIAEYWKLNRPMLERVFDDFPKTDISHDTVRRIYMLIGRDHAGQLLKRLMFCAANRSNGRVIAIDGQAVRAAKRSGETWNKAESPSETCAQAEAKVEKKEDTDKKADHPRYVLNVLDTGTTTVLQQMLVGAKTNEINASTKILDDLNIEGAVITADALNTQTSFAEKIVASRADYCLAVKSNQRNTYREIKATFDGYPGPRVEHSSGYEISHGRIELRSVQVLPGNLLTEDLLEKWKGLEEGCIIRAVTETEIKKTGEKRSDVRYYISSLFFDKDFIGSRALETVRAHWAVENRLHWVLDVTFDQDRTQCKNAHYLMGRTLMNKLIFNLLSGLQNLEEARGNEKPSKAVLKVRINSVEAFRTALAETLQAGQVQKS